MFDHLGLTEILSAGSLAVNLLLMNMTQKTKIEIANLKIWILQNFELKKHFTEKRESHHMDG